MAELLLYYPSAPRKGYVIGDIVWAAPDATAWERECCVSEDDPHQVFVVARVSDAQLLALAQRWPHLLDGVDASGLPEAGRALAIARAMCVPLMRDTVNGQGHAATEMVAHWRYRVDLDAALGMDGLAYLFTVSWSVPVIAAAYIQDKTGG